MANQLGTAALNRQWAALTRTGQSISEQNVDLSTLFLAATEELWHGLQVRSARRLVGSEPILSHRQDSPDKTHRVTAASKERRGKEFVDALADRYRVEPVVRLIHDRFTTAIPYGGISIAYAADIIHSGRLIRGVGEGSGDHGDNDEEEGGGKDEPL